MKKWWSRARSLWRGIRRRGDVEVEMSEEFTHHLELRAGDLERSGLSRAEARRRARLEFGSLEQHKHQSRASRGLVRFDDLRWSWIDVKLGARMLRKYPGLTLVGGLGMAVAITISATAFNVISSVINSNLPLAEGDRVVAIESLDLARGQRDAESHLHDLDAWRAGVPAIAEFGAFRTVDRNLIIHGSAVEVVRIAEMSASGFRIARVSPLAGRYFVDDDERPDAAPVAVIGDLVWQSRFAANPNIVGSTIQLGDIVHTIVGVMPDGFGFPINNRVWTPLRLRASAFEHGRAPPITVFGRLAPGATIAIAREQLDAAGLRVAAAHPETDRQLRPAIETYAHSFLDGPDSLWSLRVMQSSIGMLLIVIGVNVAVLVYARTATRAGEITVRTALGASRARVITQFFAEALVLAALAAVVGLVGAQIALARIDAAVLEMGGEQIPFWIRFGLTPGTVLYAIGLAMLAAVIVGVMPALKATGVRVQSSLKNLGVGGSGMQLGRVWTFMVIAQVTVTVALMPTVVGAGVAWVRWQLAQRPFPTADFVTAGATVDRHETAAADEAPREREQRIDLLRDELVARLVSDPSVSSVVLATDVPGDEPVGRVDLDRTGVRGTEAIPTGITRVDEHFFTAFDVPVLAGRAFARSDRTGTSTAVVVNEAFVYKNLGAGNPIGRRLRITAAGDQPPQPWLEIVGVVANFPAALDAKYVRPRMYLALPPAPSGALTIAARASNGDAPALARRMREIAAGIDPMLRLSALKPLEESLRDSRMILETLLLGTALVSSAALLLSTAGIYALVSLTVTRRRREIAVRLALGAESRRLLGTLLSRTLAQIAIGIAVGVVVALLLNTLDWTGILVVAVLMFAVGVGASIGPARRGLRIQPTDALKAE